MLSSRSLNAVVLGCALLASACDRQSGEPAQPAGERGDAAKTASGVLERGHKGEPIPDFTLSDAEGKAWPLGTFKGQPLLVNLWATWCAPCVAELPTLNRIANRADVGVRVVTISQDSGAPDKVRAFLDERGLAQLPSVLDPKGDLAFHYQAAALPTTVLYDAQGNEVWRYVGDKDWSSPEALELIGEAHRADAGSGG